MAGFYQFAKGPNQALHIVIVETYGGFIYEK
jgi:hypothetical protein